MNSNCNSTYVHHPITVTVTSPPPMQHTIIISNHEHLRNAQHSTSKVQKNAPNAPTYGTLAPEVLPCLQSTDSTRLQGSTNIVLINKVRNNITFMFRLVLPHFAEWLDHLILFVLFRFFFVFFPFLTSGVNRLTARDQSILRCYRRAFCTVSEFALYTFCVDWPNHVVI